MSNLPDWCTDQMIDDLCPTEWGCALCECIMQEEDEPVEYNGELFCSEECADEIRWRER